MAALKVSILQGRYKNKKITIPEKIKGHNAVTPQKIKESVFQIILNRILSPEKTVFLDLFAGSGQMGLEAISRNYGSVFFYDISMERIISIKNWTNENLHSDDISKCRFENKDSVRMFSEIFSNKHSNYTDIVMFADPPYNFIYKKKLILDYLMSEYVSNIDSSQNKSVLLIIQTSRHDIFKSEWFASEEYLENLHPEISVQFYRYGKNIIIAIKKDLPEDIF